MRDTNSAEDPTDGAEEGEMMFEAYFLCSFALAVAAWLSRGYHAAFTSFFIIAASICLVIALVKLNRDYQDARQKDQEQKRVEVRKALREAVKRLNPEYTEEQIDWWIGG